MWFYLFLIIFLASPLAHAQMQQGYSNGQPNVVVDRSVLEDLKGYQPPPMFGDESTTSEPVKTHPVKVAPPATQTLTAPKAEALLNHPVQNFRVLTERNSEPQKSAQPSIPKKAEQKKASLKSVATTKKRVIPQIKIKEEKKQAEIKPQIKQIPSPSSGGYKPKASPTMPAVPPIHVERDVLPALPIPTPEVQNITTPSVSERMIDAALERQIEKDDAKIKEKLAEEKINQVTPPNPKEKKLIFKMPNNSLEFQAGQMDLTDKIETHIRKFILPEITNDLNSRIQILSFATSPDKTESTARRISLARALSVRDYLKNLNIDVSRIDVRALTSDNSVPPDRVDIILLK